MHIAIDARFASGQVTGVGKYTLNLVRSLSKQINNNKITLFVNDNLEGVNNRDLNFLRTSITPEMHPLNELWENIALPYYLQKYKIDIFHSPAFYLPVFTPGTKKIVTIHDLAVFKHPETFPYKFSRFLQFKIKNAVKRADRIIADSKAVKSDLMDILRVREGKITVIYVGVDAEFTEGWTNTPSPTLLRGDKGGIDIFKKTKGLTQGFMLYAGTIEPRKNLINLIKAFSILKERGSKHKLVIAGKRGWLYENILEEAKSSRFGEDIIFTDYIPDSELKLYYSSCDVFVYPSLYEGFGLPPLEAGACGAPVVVSDIPVFREVLGDSAMFVNPEKPEEIAEGINVVLTDTGLREKIIVRSRERARNYSWERSAKETMRLYDEVMKG